MRKSTKLVNEYSFEIGDLFVWVKSVGGNSYNKGEFMRIRERDARGGGVEFTFDTNRTVFGTSHAAYGSAAWLSRELDAGNIVYVPLTKETK